jgi:hypothetical protein
MLNMLMLVVQPMGGHCTSGVRVPAGQHGETQLLALQVTGSSFQ